MPIADADLVTESQAVETILALFEPGWETLHPGSTAPADTQQALCVPWTADDEVSFDATQLGSPGAWLRLNILPATGVQQTQGAVARTEYGGVIMVQIFGPLGAGTLMTQLADDVRAVLSRKRVGEFRTHDAPSSRPASDGEWSMRVVTVEYRYTDTQ